jgi:XTP/dITP diphosphohydrolase
MEFVLATFNRDKAREWGALLPDAGIELRSLADFPGATSPVEDGETLLENARIKARAALALTALPVIADDTGLEVDALGGEPGVHAAYFAGPHATYDDNVHLLLDRLKGVPHARRGARFRTVCVALFPDGREVIGEGVLEGRILDERRGAGGFGYDPVFGLPDGRALAELTPDEKNGLSHRARAVRDLAGKLAAMAPRA